MCVSQCLLILYHMTHRSLGCEHITCTWHWVYYYTAQQAKDLGSGLRLSFVMNRGRFLLCMQSFCSFRNTMVLLKKIKAIFFYLHSSAHIQLEYLWNVICQTNTFILLAFISLAYKVTLVFDKW